MPSRPLACASAPTLAALALVVLGASRSAAAAETPPPDGLHVDAGVVTDFPISVGARSTLEFPSRFRLSLGAGALPDPYLDTIQGVATSAGWYSEDLATLIDKALSRAWLVHLQAGFRPFEARGFTVAFGFMPVFAAGADASSAEVDAAVETDDDEGSDYKLRSRLNLVTVQTGWEWIVKDRLVIRTSVGGAFTMAANTEATPSTDPTGRGAAVRAVGREVVEAALDETYLRYVHTPTVGLELGYRFR